MNDLDAPGPIVVRVPRWWLPLGAALSIIGLWALSRLVPQLLEHGLTQPFDRRLLFLAVTGPIAFLTALRHCGQTVEVDERTVAVFRWGRLVAGHDTRTLLRIEHPVNEYRLVFEEGQVRLHHRWERAAEACDFLRVLRDARSDRRAPAEPAVERPRGARRRGRAARPPAGPVVTLPLPYVTFPDRCGCGVRATRVVRLELEDRWLLDRLLGTVRKATVHVATCARCERRRRAGQRLLWLAPMLLAAQGVAAVFLFPTSLLLVVPIGLVFVGVPLTTSLWFERLVTRAAIGVSCKRLDLDADTVTLRFASAKRAQEVAALTAATRRAHLDAARDLVESGVEG